MTTTQRVAIGRAQILEDVYRGVFIAEDIQSFSDLHEYVDANRYGGFLEPVDFQPWSAGDRRRAEIGHGRSVRYRTSCIPGSSAVGSKTCRRGTCTTRLPFQGVDK